MQEDHLVPGAVIMDRLLHRLSQRHERSDLGGDVRGEG